MKTSPEKPTRHPDIRIDEADIPQGLALIEGKQLMLTARSAGIPYGLAEKRTYPNPADLSRSRIETVGIIIDASDVKAFQAAVANRKWRKK